MAISNATQELLDDHPRLRADLRRVPRGIHDGTASLGVCWDAADVTGLHSKPYRVDELAVVVPRGHALASRKRVKFEDTLPYEHVSLPVNSAVQVMLQREAGRLGRQLRQRVVVTSFEAALRVVRAGLAITVVPHEVAEHFAKPFGIKLVRLDERWAERRFIVCFRDENALPHETADPTRAS